MITNNKKTKEELQQEVFTKMETEFEKKRRRSIWYILLFLGASIILLPIGAWGLYIIECLIQSGRTEFTNQETIALYLGIGCIPITAILLYEAIVRARHFNVVKKPKTLKAVIKSKMHEASAVEKRLIARKSKLVTKENLSWWIKSIKEIIKVPDYKWAYFIAAMIREEKARVQQLQEAFDTLDEDIIILEAQLRYYNQVQEKTFWQYVTSKKWLKKINNNQN